MQAAPLPAQAFTAAAGSLLALPLAPLPPPPLPNAPALGQPEATPDSSQVALAGAPAALLLPGTIGMPRRSSANGWAEEGLRGLRL